MFPDAPLEGGWEALYIVHPVLDPSDQKQMQLDSSIGHHKCIFLPQSTSFFDGDVLVLQVMDIWAVLGPFFSTFSTCTDPLLVGPNTARETWPFPSGLQSHLHLAWGH